MKIKKDILYTMKEARIMIVTATEFKTTVNKLAVLDSLVGIVSEGSVMDEETIRKERLDRQ